PAGYGCQRGICIPQLADGGIPRLPDGGPAVIFGPDGGIIGVGGGPGGGPVRLPDGGVSGAPCRPGMCTEIACDNGLDDDNNGQNDCMDPSCSAQACMTTDPCARAPVCTSGACMASSTLTCNMPPPGECFQSAGTCTMGGLQCMYLGRTGASCDGG